MDTVEPSAISVNQKRKTEVRVIKSRFATNEGYYMFGKLVQNILIILQLQQRHMQQTNN